MSRDRLAGAANDRQDAEHLRLAGIITGMNVGDQVVFLDDEPELDLPEGTLATVTALYEPDYIEFQLADGRVFTTLEPSLRPAPTRA